MEETTERVQRSFSRITGAFLYLETRTWIKPGQELNTKIAFHRHHFLHITEDGFYKILGHMDTRVMDRVVCVYSYA